MPEVDRKWLTLIVVCVANSIHRIPISSPGSAVKMMNGSSHD